MKEPNLFSEPVVISGKKCWNIGKDPEGKEVYYHKKGYIKVKDGNLEQGEAIDENGNFIKKGKEKDGERD